MDTETLYVDPEGDYLIETGGALDRHLQGQAQKPVMSDYLYWRIGDILQGMRDRAYRESRLVYFGDAGVTAHRGHMAELVEAADLSRWRRVGDEGPPAGELVLARLTQTGIVTVLLGYRLGFQDEWRPIR